MRLTVDASIVIKWFIAESLSEESRLLLTRHIYLQAPDMLLSEFANTIWKKVRRREITDPTPFLAELLNLSELIALYPVAALIERASQIAFQMDHPVYDCLYLACAEVSDTTLISADKRLVEKAGERIPGVSVRHIGAPESVRWIRDAIAAAGKRVLLQSR